jgi:hypothetical protein
VGLLEQVWLQIGTASGLGLIASFDGLWTSGLFQLGPRCHILGVTLPTAGRLQAAGVDGSLRLGRGLPVPMLVCGLPVCFNRVGL